MAVMRAISNHHRNNSEGFPWFPITCHGPVCWHCATAVLDFGFLPSRRFLYTGLNTSRKSLFSVPLALMVARWNDSSVRFSYCLVCCSLCLQGTVLACITITVFSSSLTFFDFLLSDLLIWFAFSYIWLWIWRTNKLWRTGWFNRMQYDVSCSVYIGNGINNAPFLLDFSRSEVFEFVRNHDGSLVKLTGTCQFLGLGLVTVSLGILLYI